MARNVTRKKEDLTDNYNFFDRSKRSANTKRDELSREFNKQIRMSCLFSPSLRSRRKRGRGRGARTREKGDWGLGTRERLLQRPPFFHFCGRQRPQNSDWLIFDRPSHGKDEFDEGVQLEDLYLVAAGRAR